MTKEMINSPSHYSLPKYEVIDVIESLRLSFHGGNLVKYVARSLHKGKYLEDLKKALYYAKRIKEKNIKDREITTSDYQRKNQRTYSELVLAAWEPALNLATYLVLKTFFTENIDIVIARLEDEIEHSQEFASSEVSNEAE